MDQTISHKQTAAAGHPAAPGQTAEPAHWAGLVDLYGIPAPRGLAQLLCALGYAVTGGRLAQTPALAMDCLRMVLHGGPETVVPHAGMANDRAGGFCMMGAALDTETVLQAYRNGVYPCSHIGPLKWWCPDDRMVLFFDEFHIEKNLRRLMRKEKYTVSMDKRFGDVIRACAEVRPGRPPLTWIRPKMIALFERLHGEGHAHSVEVYDDEGLLVGGLYGLAVGRVFFTESQFFRARDASKVAIAALNCHLQKWGFAVNDGKRPTSHLTQLGFRLIDRDDFVRVLADHANGPSPAGPWQIDPELDFANWVPADSEGLRGCDLVPREALTAESA